ncbi:MAG: rod shape-determining protein MreC [Elusimicrobiaceae bacterium]|nr:rod shape-determining protein MreC [Elusimicrobiaceae bacterium]
MQRKTKRKNQISQISRRRKILPAVFVLLSLLLMILPLESPVASVKALLSYIFIPQIRLSHATLEYGDGVSRTIRELLDTHQENERLKAEMSQLRLQNAQAKEIFAQNERLTKALNIKSPRGWNGIWAKTAYREPTQWNSVIIDKGAAQGVQERAAAISLQEGQPILAGVVVETDENTAKVLLLQDEDFSAAVYTQESAEEGLLTGGGSAMLLMKYLPVLSKIKPGEKVYTSASSSIFPAGILVGEVDALETDESFSSAPFAYVKPQAQAPSVRELFILTRQENEGKK